MHESSGSTESLLEEADEFVRHCNEETPEGPIKTNNRRCSEADIQRGEFRRKFILDNGWLNDWFFSSPHRFSPVETITAVSAKITEMLKTRSVGESYFKDRSCRCRADSILWTCCFNWLWWSICRPTVAKCSWWLWWIVWEDKVLRMVRVFLHFSLKADLKFSSLFTVKIITDFLCHSRKSSWRGTRKSLAILKVALLKEMFCDQLTTRIMTRNITSLMSDAFNCRDRSVKKVISIQQICHVSHTPLH